MVKSKTVEAQMSTSKFILLASVAFISSCSVGPDYKRPQFFGADAISESLNLSGKKQNIAKDWYQQFNDPFLNTLIARGLENSPTVGVAIEKLRQARQSLRINAVQNLPTLDADGSYNYSKEAINYGIPVSSDYYQLGIDASWEIDIWGGGRRLTESSLALVRAAGASLDNVRLSLTAEIATNYINLRQTQEQLRIAKKNLELQQSIYELVNEKYKVGLTDDISLNQASYIVKNTEMQIPELEASVTAYQNALAILIGQLPGQLDAMLQNPEQNLVAKPYKFDLQQLYDLPINVVRERPDVREVEEQLIAQNAKIGQAIAKLFPNVSIRGFLGYQSQKLSNLISHKHDMYSYSPAISLPLFHWGALVNNVELEKSATAEQMQLYKSSLLTAVGDIRNATTALSKEAERNISAAAAKKAQLQVANLTLEKYKQGLIEFSDVLTSQQNLLSAQTSYVESNATIYKSIISFYKSVGGGYITDTRLSQKSVSKREANATCKG